MINLCTSNVIRCHGMTDFTAHIAEKIFVIILVNWHCILEIFMKKIEEDTDNFKNINYFLN